MRTNRRLLGWGAVFIIAGAIPLAVRAGALPAASLAGWPSLWPFLLVGGGLGLIFRRTPLHLLGGSVSVLTAGVMVGGLLATGFDGVQAFGACGASPNAPAFPDQSGSLSDPSDVDVEFDCGHLAIGTADGNDWTLRGSGPASHPPQVSTADGVLIRSSNDLAFSDPASTWTLTLPRGPGMALSVTLNAGQATLDLDQATLDSLSLTLNAGALTADLSQAERVANISATINAGSAAITLPSSAGSVSVTLNAGSTKVCVPTGTALRVEWNGTIATNNFDAAGLVRQDDSHWTTGGQASAIDLNVSANAGAFTLVFGGACRA